MKKLYAVALVSIISLSPLQATTSIDDVLGSLCKFQGAWILARGITNNCPTALLVERTFGGNANPNPGLRFKSIDLETREVSSSPWDRPNFENFISSECQWSRLRQKFGWLRACHRSTFVTETEVSHEVSFGYYPSFEASERTRQVLSLEEEKLVYRAFWVSGKIAEQCEFRREY